MDKMSSRALLLQAAERGIGYLHALERRSVAPLPEDIERLHKALDAPMPAEPSDATQVLTFIDELGSPATVASAGGRYFGFVTGGAMPVTVAANWLATAWDQNAFSFVSSPAIALFEEAALRWVKQALDLPPDSEGAIVTGATMANLTCLAAARHDVLKRCGWDVERGGLFGAPEITLIVSDEVHGSVCLLIDDIVDSGGTLCNAAEALLANGATSVTAYITHGVLSGGAAARIASSKLKELVTTDSIQPTSGVEAAHNIRVISIADLIGEAISRTATEESVSSLFD